MVFGQISRYQGPAKAAHKFTIMHSIPTLLKNGTWRPLNYCVIMCLFYSQKWVEATSKLISKIIFLPKNFFPSDCSKTCFVRPGKFHFSLPSSYAIYHGSHAGNGYFNYFPRWKHYDLHMLPSQTDGEKKFEIIHWEMWFFIKWSGKKFNKTKPILNQYW